MRPLRIVTGWASRHPAVASVAVVALLGFAIGGFLWFRPDKLFVDEAVDEAFPTPAATATASPDPGEAPSEQPVQPVRLAAGAFESHNRYTTTGRARAFRLEDGSRVLRLEMFRTSNGPDLVVYLSAAPPGTSDRSLADDFIDLGALKGNVGNQNYAIPGDVDLDRYATVVIWCRRFTVSFGAAVLSA